MVGSLIFVGGRVNYEFGFDEGVKFFFGEGVEFYGGFFEG